MFRRMDIMEHIKDYVQENVYCGTLKIMFRRMNIVEHIEDNVQKNEYCGTY